MWEECGGRRTGFVPPMEGSQAAMVAELPAVFCATFDASLLALSTLFSAVSVKSEE